MGKTKRLIIDLIGALVGAVALGLGIYVLLGEPVKNFNLMTDDYKNLIGGYHMSTALVLTYTAICLGSLSLIFFLVACFMIWRKKRYVDWTGVIWISAIVAVSFVLYGVIKRDDWQAVYDAAKAAGEMIN